MSARVSRTDGPVICRARPGSRRDRRRESLRWPDVDRRLRALDKWERRRVKARGSKIRGVGHVGRAVLEFLMRHRVKHGVLDDLSYGHIARVVGYARSAVVAASERLRVFGWLTWLRRWQPNAETGRVEQICNEFQLVLPEADLKRMGIAVDPKSPVPPEVETEAAAKARVAAQFRAIDTGLDAALQKLGVGVAGRLSGTRETS